MFDITIFLIFPWLYWKEFDRICNICIMNWYIAGTRNLVFSKSLATRGSRSSLCKNVISYFCESAANDNIKGSLISTFHVSQPGQTCFKAAFSENQLWQQFEETMKENRLKEPLCFQFHLWFYFQPCLIKFFKMENSYQQLSEVRE